MRFYVEHIFELGDLGERHGYAEGSVEKVDFEHAWGFKGQRLDTQITKAVAYLISRDGQTKQEIDVLPFIDKCTRNAIAEALEEKYRIAMFKEAGA
jgi:hypothetical protein